jgi:hypothetical protein
LPRSTITLQLGLTLVDNSATMHGARPYRELAGERACGAPDWTLQLQRSPGNIGYGRGNNLVIAGARSDYHLVVNPDLFVDATALLEACVSWRTHADVGLLTPAVFGEDGERHYLCKRNPTLLVMFLRSFSPHVAAKELEFLIPSSRCAIATTNKPIHPSNTRPVASCFSAPRRCRKSAASTPTFSCTMKTPISAVACCGSPAVVYVPSVRVVHQWARDTHRSLGAKLGTVRSGWLYWRQMGRHLQRASLWPNPRRPTSPPSRRPGSGGAKGPGDGRQWLYRPGLVRGLVVAGLPACAGVVRKKNGNGQAAPDCWAWATWTSTPNGRPRWPGWTALSISRPVCTRCATRSGSPC